MIYTVPDRIPFEDSTVSYIHCSHLVEHLYYAEFHSFLQEIDRVLKPEGILVISTPLLWGNFYNDLSHVRPYNPGTFIMTLCRKANQTSLGSIGENYSTLEQVYRYTTVYFEEWGSEYRLVDFVIQVSKGILRQLGIKKYTKNGYTLVLRKGKNSKE